MGRLRTALTIAMRAGKPIRSAADIVKEGRAAWTAGRATRAGRTAAGIADDIAGKAAARANLVRRGGGGMVPTGGSSVVGRGSGGALVPQGSTSMVGRGGSGAMVPQGGSALMRLPDGALVRQGSGAMTPYNPGGALQRMIPPAIAGTVPMFYWPGTTQPPTVGPSEAVPTPEMMPRAPMPPSMPPAFTPTAPNGPPPSMPPRSPVPVSMPPMPDMPMTVPPMMELPEPMPLTPHVPTMPDMSMGPPDITMPGFEAVFDDPDPLMDLGIQDAGLLDALPVPDVLPTPMEPPGGFHYRTPHPMPLPAYRRGY